MALSFDETSMQVTPVLSVDLGVYSQAMGSAQMLTDGNYFFLCAIVPAGQLGVLTGSGFGIEIQPAEGNRQRHASFKRTGSSAVSSLATKRASTPRR